MLEVKESAILFDYEEKRIFARNQGLKVKGTLVILVEHYKNKYISREVAKESLRKINEIMYLSGEVFEFILRKLEE